MYVCMYIYIYIDIFFNTQSHTHTHAHTQMKITHAHNYNHTSHQIKGPWIPLPSIPHSGCNNPAPAFAQNGSLYVLCNSNSIWRTDAPEEGAGWIKVATVDLNASPWVTPSTSKYIRIEDPYLWNDKNGNWHLFCHRYDYRDGWPTNPSQSEPVLVSGHAFSTDLQEWHYSMGKQPFDPWVVFEDGTRQNYSTLERPVTLR